MYNQNFTKNKATKIRNIWNQKNKGKGVILLISKTPFLIGLKKLQTKMVTFLIINKV